MSRGIVAVTLSHCRPEVLEFGLSQFYATAGIPEDFRAHFVVDHHYPIHKAKTSREVESIAKKYKCRVLTPHRNMGGHGGFNWAFHHNEVQELEWDIICGYDPDSNPIQPGWLPAMANVLRDPEGKVAYCSLTHEHIRPNHRWTVEQIGGETVQFAERPDMYNVTSWRRDFLVQTQGLHALKSLYGHVELAMDAKRAQLKVRHAHLQNYLETLCPVPHDTIYNDWKAAHAFLGFNGNFDEWVRLKCPEKML